MMVWTASPAHALFLDCIGGKLTLHVEHLGYMGSSEAYSGSRQPRAAPFLYESGMEHTLFLECHREEQAAVPQMSPWDESLPMLLEIMMAVLRPIMLTANVVCTTGG